MINNQMDDEVRIPETINSSVDGDNSIGSSDAFSSAPPLKRKALDLSSVFSKVKGLFDRPVAATAAVGVSSDVGSRPNLLPFIGHLPSRTQYLAGSAVVVATLFGAALAGGYGARQVNFSNQRSVVSSTVQMLTQRIASASESAIQGDIPSIEKIRKTTADLSAQMNLLLDGDSETGMSGLKDRDVDQVVRLEKSTRTLIERAHTILENATALMAIDKNIDKADQSTQDIFSLASQLESVLSGTGASRVQIGAAEHVRVLAERMRTNSVIVLQSKKPEQSAHKQIITDFKSLTSTLAGLEKGNAELGISAVSDRDSRALVGKISAVANDMGDVVAFVDKNASNITKNRTEQGALIQLSDTALADALSLSKKLANDARDYGMYQILSGVLLILSILGVFLVGTINTRLTKIEGWESRRKNRMNEDGIIQFMTEVAPLEEGDLTLDLTHDTEALEGITGGIRSTVNEAVNALREAVDTVKTTAASVSAVVGKSVASSTVLDTANMRQAGEIESIVKNVEGLTATIAKVTENTLRAAEMTQQAKVASAAAADVVATTNERMTGSRLKIQEVLKSAKRQGETSHEIGQVAELIENITDMTRVIAVNASLEAAKAGAAGAGFQVLAGEVSRLAEQSNELLVTITALVQRNQGETAATIRSVEEATNSVVEGAQLAEAANEKLREIAVISNDVAQFVNDIRLQSEDQSATASDVRSSMERLSVLSRDSQKAVSEVVLSVSEINDSMGMLESTVATFKTRHGEEV